MHRVPPFRAVMPLAVLMLLPLSRPASAQLQLTAAGTSAGFTLSTFATGFPTQNGVGPVGIAFNAGHVIVSDIPGNVRVFATDTDNQTAASAPVGQNFGYGNAHDVAVTNGRIFASQFFTSKVVELNADGSYKQDFVTIPGNARALITNPLNNHLLVAGQNNIYDLDPASSMVTFITSIGAGVDGITTDGTIVYGAVGGNSIQGFRLSDGGLVFNSGFIGGGPDGAAVGTGTLAGNLFVNTNDGHVLEINLMTLTQTVIAQFGSRGDFTTVDPSNGSLLLTQTSEIDRLLAPAGGGFGNTTPEPGSMALLMGMGITGAGFLVRCKRVRRIA